MLHIRLICSDDAVLLADYYQRNSAHFLPWEPLRSAGYYDVDSVKQRLEHDIKLQQQGEAAYFVALAPALSMAVSPISTSPPMHIVAHCALTHIIYGPLQSCFMGYGVDHSHQGRGVMRELCQAAITYAFSQLQLNRIVANVMPHNHRSMALLQRLGFMDEGIAHKYLCIQGQWQDHRVMALLHPRHSREC